MNLILEGKDGSGKRAKALELAEKELGIKPQMSASFLMVEPDEKGLLSVSKISEISEFCSYAGQKVIIVTNLHKGTEKFQQSLLKLLEDTPDVSFYITSEGELLDTIYSRCQRRRVTSPSMNEAIEQINRLHKTQMPDPKIWRLSGSSVSLYERLSEDMKFVELANTVIDWTLLGDERLFEAVGVIKEDASTLYQKFGAEKVGILLDALSNELIEDNKLDAAWYIEQKKEAVLTKYSKSLWFCFWKDLWKKV